MARGRNSTGYVAAKIRANTARKNGVARRNWMSWDGTADDWKELASDLLLTMNDDHNLTFNEAFDAQIRRYSPNSGWTERQAIAFWTIDEKWLRQEVAEEIGAEAAWRLWGRTSPYRDTPHSKHLLKMAEDWRAAKEKEHLSRFR